MVELGLPKTQIAATVRVSGQTLSTALKKAERLRGSAEIVGRVIPCRISAENDDLTRLEAVERFPEGAVGERWSGE